MLGFIEKPHLPQSRVRHIIIGNKYRNTLENALIQNNLSPIWLRNNEFADERLSGHCDLMAAHLGGSRITVYEFLKNRYPKDRAVHGTKSDGQGVSHGRRIKFLPYWR